MSKTIWFQYKNKTRPIFITRAISANLRHLYYKYCDENNIELTESDKDEIGRQVYISGCTYKARDQYYEFCTRYLNKFDEEELHSFETFDLIGKEAHMDVYELLWGWCRSHSSFAMATAKGGHIHIPSNVDIYLPETFGETFYIAHEDKVSKGLSHETQKIVFPIVVNKVKRIQGRLSYFYITFTDGYYLRFRELWSGKRKTACNVYLTYDMVDTTDYVVGLDEPW